VHHINDMNFKNGKIIYMSLVCCLVDVWSVYLYFSKTEVFFSVLTQLVLVSTLSTKEQKIRKCFWFIMSKVCFWLGLCPITQYLVLVICRVEVVRNQRKSRIGWFEAYLLIRMIMSYFDHWIQFFSSLSLHELIIISVVYAAFFTRIWALFYCLTPLLISC